ncbi:MAG: hypothetical protein AB7O21_10345 [Gammaproteobacteria bacterium]
MRHGAALGILAAWACAVHADDLGRLFFDREARTALDAARAAVTAPVPAGHDEPAALPATTDPVPVSAPPPPVTLNGIVTRSHGPATVWVNGEPRDARHLALPGFVDGDARVVGSGLEIARDGSAPRRVRAGQTYDPASDTLHDTRDPAPPVADGARD